METSPSHAFHPSPWQPAQLRHCPHLPHGLGMDEMIITPDGRVIIILPLQVNIQVGQMITLGDSKLLPDLITLLLSALGRKRGPLSTGESRPTEESLEVLLLSPANTQNSKHTSECLNNI